MRFRSWTARVVFYCSVLVAAVVVFLFVVRVTGIAPAGVEPEAFVLTAMMTAPFSLGFLLLVILGTVVVERFLSRVAGDYRLCPCRGFQWAGPSRYVFDVPGAIW